MSVLVRPAVAPAAPTRPEAGRLRSRRGDALLVAALLAAAALLRAGPLAPASLWLDDAWPALVSRVDAPADLLVVGLTAPGFVALLGGAVALGGDAPVVAQSLPFLAGVTAVAGVFVVARLAGLSRSAALVGAAVLLTSPLHLTYSSRVKQYTLEGLAALALTAVVLLLARSPGRPALWAALGLLAVVGTAVSSAVAVPSAAALAAAALVVLRARRADRRAAARGLAATGVVVGAFTAAWWWLVVRVARNDVLAGDWAEFYGVAHADEVLRGLAPVPVALTGVALLAGALVAVRRQPVLAVAALGPVALAAGLAVAGIAPLGGGRTDLYLYPGLTLLVAAGAAAVLPLGRRLVPRGVVPPGVVPGVVAALAAAALVAAAPVPAQYPQEEVRPLVESLDAQARPGDVVLVYSAARWAHALYTAWPVTVSRSAATPNGFVAVPTPPPGVELVVLPPQRDTPEGHRAVVPGAVGGAGRVWVLTAHTSPDVEVLRDALGDAGLAPVAVEPRAGAELSRWEPR